MQYLLECLVIEEAGRVLGEVKLLLLDLLAKLPAAGHMLAGSQTSPCPGGSTYIAFRSSRNALRSTGPSLHNQWSPVVTGLKLNLHMRRAIGLHGWIVAVGRVGCEQCNKTSARPRESEWQDTMEFSDGCSRFCTC